MTGPFDSRETRDFAREIKFLVDASRADDVREWARAHLGPDPHGTGRCGDEYVTTSLYFDTPAFDVYHRNRSHARGKFRIRRYGLLDFIFLERKMRTDRLLAKRRTTVPLDALQRVGEPDVDRNWPGYWFHRRILLRGLRPLVQISYDRTARRSGTRRRRPPGRYRNPCPESVYPSQDVIHHPCDGNDRIIRLA